MVGGIQAAAWLRYFRNPVRRVYSQRLAPPLQRPVLHLQFSPGVLYHPRRRLGHEQWAWPRDDGAGNAQWPHAAGLSPETRPAADDAGTDRRTPGGGECVRPLGAGSRGVLQPSMEGAGWGGGG